MAQQSEIENLTQRQQAAIVALLSETTVAAAAKHSGVPMRTLYGWLQSDATFQAAYQAAQRQAFSQALGRLQHASTKAVDVLLKIMSSKTASDGMRLRAAIAVLDIGLRERDNSIAERIEALERLFSEK